MLIFIVERRRKNEEETGEKNSEIKDKRNKKNMLKITRKHFLWAVVAEYVMFSVFVCVCISYGYV